MTIRELERPVWKGRQPVAMVVTDLDGTLLRSDRTLGREDRQALEDLGAEGVVRVAATGRSPFSLRRALDGTEPLDFAVVSSGAGVLEFRSGRLLRAAELAPAVVDTVAGILEREGLGFMVHHPLPENHRFAYHCGNSVEPDFQRRLELYAGYCHPLEGPCGAASQLLAIVPAGDGEGRAAHLRRLLPGLSVIRATSPLDHASTWLEVFPPRVSKSEATSWLAGALGILPRNVLALGNDYNDLDLLEWAGTSAVVANAPEDLLARFPVVPGNDEAGFARAVRMWMENPGLGS